MTPELESPNNSKCFFMQAGKLNAAKFFEKKE
jgi:hypothetical protein